MTERRPPRICRHMPLIHRAVFPKEDSQASVILDEKMSFLGSEPEASSRCRVFRHTTRSPLRFEPAPRNLAKTMQQGEQPDGKHPRTARSGTYVTPMSWCCSTLPRVECHNRDRSHAKTFCFTFCGGIRLSWPPHLCRLSPKMGVRRYGRSCAETLHDHRTGTTKCELAACPSPIAAQSLQIHILSACLFRMDLSTTDVSICETRAMSLCGLQFLRYNAARKTNRRKGIPGLR